MEFYSYTLSSPLFSPKHNLSLFLKNEFHSLIISYHHHTISPSPHHITSPHHVISHHITSHHIITLSSPHHITPSPHPQPPPPHRPYRAADFVSFDFAATERLTALNVADTHRLLDVAVAAHDRVWLHSAGWLFVCLLAWLIVYLSVCLSVYLLA